MCKIYQKNIVCYKNGIKRKNGGFTLIELLVVVLIIGILAAIAVPKYQKAVRRAKAAEYAVWVKRIVDAEQEYFMTNGRYTGNIDELGIEYKDKWPNVIITENSTISMSKNFDLDFFLYVYAGASLKVHIGEPIKTYGKAYGGYGAQLNARDPSRNYLLLCSEYANHGVPAGSYCHDIMGATGEPIDTQDVRFYKLP